VVPESNLIIAWRPAELWRRILAKVLDGLFFLLLLSPVVDYGVRSSFRWHNIGPFALVTLLFPFLEIVLTKVFQGTPGKRIMGMRVLRLDARPLDWIDSIQRQILILVLLLVQSLQVAASSCPARNARPCTLDAKLAIARAWQPPQFTAATGRLSSGCLAVRSAWQLTQAFPNTGFSITMILSTGQTFAQIPQLLQLLFTLNLSEKFPRLILSALAAFKSRDSTAGGF